MCLPVSCKLEIILEKTHIKRPIPAKCSFTPHSEKLPVNRPVAYTAYSPHPASAQTPSLRTVGKPDWQCQCSKPLLTSAKTCPRCSGQGLKACSDEAFEPRTTSPRIRNTCVRQHEDADLHTVGYARDNSPRRQDSGRSYRRPRPKTGTQPKSGPHLASLTGISCKVDTDVKPTVSVVPPSLPARRHRAWSDDPRAMRPLSTVASDSPSRARRTEAWVDAVKPLDWAIGQSQSMPAMPAQTAREHRLPSPSTKPRVGVAPDLGDRAHAGKVEATGPQKGRHEKHRVESGDGKAKRQ